MSNLDPNCIFCKIIKSEIPSMKLTETEKTFAFLDIGPLSPGHALVIPKYHAAKLHELPDEHLAELLPIAKKLAIATGAENYNILQNNGRPAHQEVFHVHGNYQDSAIQAGIAYRRSRKLKVHVIPKPSPESGLVIGWPATKPEQSELKKIFEDMKNKL